MQEVDEYVTEVNGTEKGLLDHSAPYALLPVGDMAELGMDLQLPAVHFSEFTPKAEVVSTSSVDTIDKGGKFPIGAKDQLNLVLGRTFPLMEDKEAIHNVKASAELR